MTEPVTTVEPRGQWLLMQPPAPAEMAQHLRQVRILRVWTIIYLLVCVAFAVILVFGAVKRFSLGEIGMGFYLSWMVVQTAVFAMHLVIGLPGLLGGSHVRGAVACFLHLRQRHAEANDHFVKAFNPQGPLDVVGVRPENATEYMLLVHQADDCEQYLEALRERLDELRDNEDWIEPDA